MMDDVYDDDYISDVSSVSDIDELSACNEVIHHVTCFLNSSTNHSYTNT